MTTLAEVKDVAQKLERIKTKRSELSGEKKALFTQLKTHGYTSIDTAKKENAKIIKSLAEREKKLLQEVEYFKKQYGSILGV